MKNQKSSSIFVGILLIHVALIIFIRNALYPIHLVNQYFYVLELLGKTVRIPYEILFLFDLGNLIMLWLISKRFFSGHFSLIPVLIYAISPWSSYLVAAESFNIFLSFLLLLTFYGLVILNSENKFWAVILVGGGMLGILYSSYLLLLISPLILISVAVFKIIPFKKLKIIFIFIFILNLPLLFLIYTHQVGFKNIASNEVKVFNDPGLLNSSDSFKGEARQAGLSQLAKISENKYIFSLEFLSSKFIKQLIPATYLTQQEKLLNFSFTPPLYFGFLIPLSFGLYKILKSPTLKKPLFLSSLLVIPSALSKFPVDLTRLFYFAPVIIIVTSFGFVELIKKRQKKLVSIVLVITLFLIIFQLFTTLSDIQLREKSRYLKYFPDQTYEVGKQ